MRVYLRRFAIAAIIFGERLPDFFRARANQLDLALKQKAQTIDRVDIERITDCDDQSALAEPDRNDFETVRVFRPNLMNHFRRNDLGRKIDAIVILFCLHGGRGIREA